MLDIIAVIIFIQNDMFIEFFYVATKMADEIGFARHVNC